MNTEYSEIKNFEEILSLAQKNVSEAEEGYRINFNLKTCFSVELLKTPQLIDVAEKAKQWQSVLKPDNLYINHGAYIGEDGISHIVQELTNKHRSNRALFSILSQAQIIGSGDSPIPSFAIFQAGIEGTNIFATTYFRALEVEKFLRINIEEFRLILNTICASFKDVEMVYLNCIAFRAYANKDISALELASIDQIDEATLLKIIEKRPKEISELLVEKASPSSVVEIQSIRNLNEIICNDLKNQDVSENLKTPHIKSLLGNCISRGEELAKLRTETSHHEDIEVLTEAFLTDLKALSRAFDL